MALLKAHCQNSLENAVKIFPDINVVKQMKNERFRPILKKGKNSRLSRNYFQRISRITSTYKFDTG